MQSSRLKPRSDSVSSIIPPMNQLLHCKTPRLPKKISSLLTSPSSATTNSSSKKYKTPLRKPFYTFDDIISNCDDLQKEISEASVSIEQVFTERKSIICNERPIKHVIRNESYFKGAQKIEDKLKERKAERFPKNLKKIKGVLSGNVAKCEEQTLNDEDIKCSRAVEYLASNKRKFGKMLDEVKEIQPKNKYKLKSIDIKANPEQTVMDLLRTPNSGTQKKAILRHNSLTYIDKRSEINSASCAKIYTEGPASERKKLPRLSMAMVVADKAKAEANRFFIDRKAISSKFIKKKKVFYENRKFVNSSTLLE